ncbi:rhodanese-like domain-containing protein [bacterium]|nr:rhodanese-like domain-containing protein [bacterium]
MPNKPLINNFLMFLILSLFTSSFFIPPALSMGEKTFNTRHKKTEEPDDFSKFHIPVINSSTAYKLWNGKKAVFVDALPPEHYYAQHIPGAINLPASDPETNWHKFLDVKKDDIIIAYGASKKSDAGKTVAKYLKYKGYTQVYYYKQGLKTWIYHLLPTETQEQQ